MYRTFHVILYKLSLLTIYDEYHTTENELKISTSLHANNTFFEVVKTAPYAPSTMHDWIPFAMWNSFSTGKKTREKLNHVKMEEATELTDTQQLLRAVSPASSRQQQSIHDRHNSELGPPVSDVCFLFFHFFPFCMLGVRVWISFLFFFLRCHRQPGRAVVGFGSPPGGIYVILAKPLRVALGFWNFVSVSVNQSRGRSRRDVPVSLPVLTAATLGKMENRLLIFGFTISSYHLRSLLSSRPILTPKFFSK